MVEEVAIVEVVAVSEVIVEAMEVIVEAVGVLAAAIEADSVEDAEDSVTAEAVAVLAAVIAEDSVDVVETVDLDADRPEAHLVVDADLLAEVEE